MITGSEIIGKVLERRDNFLEKNLDVVEIRMNPCFIRILLSQTISSKNYQVEWNASEYAGKFVGIPVKADYQVSEIQYVVEEAKR